VSVALLPPPDHLDAGPRRRRARRVLVLMAVTAVLATLLTACGRGGTTQERPAAASTSTGSESFPRTVRHELGTTTVPARPQRVVAVTDGAELASLLALGVTPVGFGQRNDPLRPWIRDRGGAGIPAYRVAGDEVSYERMAAWRPDLLVVQAGFATKENLARYSAIAPTVVTSFVDWRESLRQVAEATGATQRAQELVTANDAAVARVKAALAGRAGLKVEAVTVFDGPQVYRLNSASPLGKLAPQLGLAPFPQQKTSGEAVESISLEKLPEIDADVLLVQDFGRGRAAYEALRQRDIWKRIPAVAAGRVVELTVDESEASYFDSVLTVPRNLDMLQDRLK
jgi:iron complex transport system substrate-binding protein